MKIAWGLLAVGAAAVCTSCNVVRSCSSRDVKAQVIEIARDHLQQTSRLTPLGALLDIDNPAITVRNIRTVHREWTLLDCEADLDFGLRLRSQGLTDGSDPAKLYLSYALRDLNQRRITYTVELTRHGPEVTVYGL